MPFEPVKFEDLPVEQKNKANQKLAGLNITNWPEDKVCDLGEGYAMRLSTHGPARISEFFKTKERKK